MQFLRPSKRIPLDVLLIGSTLAFLFFLLSLLGILLLSEVAEMTSKDTRKVLFGIVCLNSELSHGVYMLLTGLSAFVASIGIIRAHKWAQKLMIFCLANGIVDAIFVLSRFHFSSPMFIGIQLALIVWLVYRNPFFANKIM